jgi:hypothetical protein
VFTTTTTIQNKYCHCTYNIASRFYNLMLIREQGKNNLYLLRKSIDRTLIHKSIEYFTSDNEPDGIENATHNTLPKLT